MSDELEKLITLIDEDGYVITKVAGVEYVSTTPIQTYGGKMKFKDFLQLEFEPSGL